MLLPRYADLFLVVLLSLQKHVQWEEKYNNIKIAFYPHQFDHYNFSKNRKVSEDFFNGLYELTVV